ncbi:MAG: tetratricopeptide repeat protein [Aquabacterium sp.]|jgi:tetratricopeptide (TPR) repeat protein|nr:MAG: tetratricopeptide repeat protein [Aquabacterium sp.]
MPLPHRASLSAVAALCLMAAGQHGVHAAPAAQAPAPTASAPAEPAKPEPYRSSLSGEIMYLVLGGEFSADNGDPAAASEWLLEAAKRSKDKDERLFQRSVKFAVEGGDGTRALTAVRAWRAAAPQSREAAQYAALILVRLNRLDEAAEPLRALVTLAPAPERAKVIIADLPAALAPLPDKKAAAALLDKIVQPLRGESATAAPAAVASARVHKEAGDTQRAVGQLKEALAKDPHNEVAALLAVDLIGAQPEAEQLVTRYLAAGKPSNLVRQEYARRLSQSSRVNEATVQVEAMTKSAPDLAGPWLYLGALRMDLRQYDAAEAALKRFLEVNAKSAAAKGAPRPAGKDDDEADGQATALVSGDARADAPLVQAYLLLSQVAEERDRLDEARAWMDKIPASAAKTLPVQTRRATLLVRQNRIDEARAVLQQAPVANDQELRARFVAEALLLRDAERLQDAYSVLQEATKRFPDDTDLLYQQSLIAEQLGRYEEMEKTLRHIIELDKDHFNAHNALGFSLANRNQRLPEAKQLIQRALELSPGDPYIIDSLAWVEFRLGNSAEALKLLRQAFAARQDPEIAAHLGEVLWATGDRDEARKVWRSAQNQTKEKANTTLQDTLKRLQVKL